MNWETVGVFAEVVSAVAVVVSLVYVGRQVQQSNIVARADSVHLTNAQWSTMMSLLATDGELAHIYRKAIHGETLDPDEFVRYTGFLMTYIAFVEDVHNQQLAGIYPIDLLDSDVASFLTAQYSRLLKSSQAREWFETEATEFLAPDVHSRMLACLNANEKGGSVIPKP